MASVAALLKFSGIYVAGYGIATSFFPRVEGTLFEKVGNALGLPVHKFADPLSRDTLAFTAMTGACELSIAYYCWQAGQDNDLKFGKMSVFGRLILNSVLVLSTLRGEMPIHVTGPTVPFEILMAYLTYEALKNEGAW